MAETLSIVTGGIALLEIAGRLGGRVLRLKQLFYELQEVPHTIRDLLDQMDVVEPMLDQIDDDLMSSTVPSSSWPMVQNDLSAVLSMRYCRKAKDDLTDLIEELSVDIAASKWSKRGLARAKVYLKKESLARSERRLQKALMLLQTSQTLYVG